MCNDVERAGRFLSVSFMTRGEGNDKCGATFLSNHHSSSLIIKDDEGTLAEYERYLLGLSFSVWMRAKSLIDVCHR